MEKIFTCIKNIGVWHSFEKMKPQLCFFLKKTFSSFISDHCMVNFTLTIPKENMKNETVTFRNFKKLDRDKFCELLKFNNELSDLDDLVQNFESSLSYALEKCAPKLTVTRTVRNQNEWFNDELCQQKRIVRNREKIFKKYHEEHHWLALKKERNRYNYMLKQVKKEVRQDKIMECKGNSRRLFEIFNSMTGKRSENPMPEGKADEELANEFLGFFMDKIYKIRDSLKDIPLFSPTERRNLPKLNQLDELNELEVNRIINSLASKSCEMDAIPATLLKELLDHLLPTITNIIREYLREGSFVNTWKTAIIRPLLKKNGLDLIPSNYRPVSNLTFLSKVLEKAALQQFRDHCDEHGLMPDYQSAYRPGYSCETALVKLMNDLLWSMENQEVTAIMAIDLSAAFDTVDHEILLKVLEINFGIGGNALKWFGTYLTPRYCKVNVGKSYSNVRDLPFSVPQGSCAGPVLYLAYASTMEKVVSESIGVHGYADDHALRKSFRPIKPEDEQNAILDLEQNAMTIKAWMDANRLKMNSGKTEFVLFGSKANLSKCTSSILNVNGNAVERTNSIKYLGAILDEELKLRKHIIRKCQIAMSGLKRIKNIRDSLTKEAAEVLVLGIVISHLDYANGIFIGVHKCDLKGLQRVQNVAARLVLGPEAPESNRDCLKSLHWLPIELRIKFKILCLVFKAVHGESPLYMREMLTECQSVRSLRSNSMYKKLEIPIVKRQTFANRSFSVQGPKWWNAIPNFIKQSESYDIFKKKLKTYIFNEF